MNVVGHDLHTLGDEAFFDGCFDNNFPESGFDIAGQYIPAVVDKSTTRNASQGGPHLDHRKKSSYILSISLKNVKDVFSMWLTTWFDDHNI